jgi:hypothetical protein
MRTRTRHSPRREAQRSRGHVGLRGHLRLPVGCALDRADPGPQAAQPVRRPGGADVRGVRLEAREQRPLRRGACDVPVERGQRTRPHRRQRPRAPRRGSTRALRTTSPSGCSTVSCGSRSTARPPSRRRRGRTRTATDGCHLVELGAVGIGGPDPRRGDVRQIRGGFVRLYTTFSQPVSRSLRSA